MKKNRAAKENERTNHMRTHVFLQFILIIFVITTIVLLSSSSFYVSMIESRTAASLHSTVLDVNSCDLDRPGVISRIENIERKNNTIIEIYKKGDNSLASYDRLVYAKYAQNKFFSNDTVTERHDQPEPMINYLGNDFKEIQKFSDGSNVGILKNIDSKYDFFVMTRTSDDGNYLFVTAVRYSIIESQAKSISISVLIVSFVIFLIISVVIYFYITRVTKPLKVITNETIKMAESGDINVRIPTRKRKISEIDTMISSINSLYESLILTQEKLKEKSEILLNELEEKDMEQKFREEFIADTSHELKTPIAIIQGYAEGAQFVKDDPKALDEYCNTIIDECNRMNSLVINMMSLSDIKHNVNDLKMEEFSIKEFISTRIMLHEKIFAKNKISVENLVNDEIYGFADLNKLSFVLNNMLSNAISYIGNEQKLIRIRYEKLELAYRIFVFNSGPPISREKLEKLWDSFYRGDTARVRTNGHFGLGLSIIKAVQDAHSQQCGVDNTDGGVEFWFDILKKE